MSAIYNYFFSSDLTNSLLSLNDDSLNEVFKHLPVHDLLAIGSTCKRCNKLASQDFLWKEFAEKLEIVAGAKYKELIQKKLQKIPIENCPTFLKAEKIFVMTKVRKSGKNLGDFPNFGNDKQVVLAAIQSKDFEYCHRKYRGSHSYDQKNYTPSGASDKLAEDRDIIDAAWWVKANREEKTGFYIHFFGSSTLVLALALAGIRSVLSKK